MQEQEERLVWWEQEVPAVGVDFFFFKYFKGRITFTKTGVGSGAAYCPFPGTYLSLRRTTAAILDISTFIKYALQ